jgi:uncharacterized membrane protein
MRDIVSARPAGNGLRTGRIEALSDGVFSIAMTLLVLELHVPDGNLSDRALLEKLGEIGPHIGFYALSFLILGIYWVGHHNQFFYIRRANRELLWINILFLGFIAFIPFSTGLLGTQMGTQVGTGERVALIVYAANLIAVSLILYLHWWYGVTRGQLVDAPLAPPLIRTVTRRILTPPLIYFIAILLTFVVNPLVSLGLIVLVQISYVLPAHLDLHFAARTTSEDAPSGGSGSPGVGDH